MAQWIKDQTLSLLWLGLQLWHWFSPWPGNFCMLGVQPKKNKKRERERLRRKYLDNIGRWIIKQ